MKSVAFSAGSRHDMRTSFSNSAPTGPENRIRAGTARRRRGAPEVQLAARDPMDQDRGHRHQGGDGEHGRRRVHGEAHEVAAPGVDRGAHAPGEGRDREERRWRGSCGPPRPAGRAPPHSTIRGRRPMTKARPMPRNVARSCRRRLRAAPWSRSAVDLRRGQDHAEAQRDPGQGQRKRERAPGHGEGQGEDHRDLGHHHGLGQVRQQRRRRPASRPGSGSGAAATRRGSPRWPARRPAARPSRRGRPRWRARRAPGRSSSGSEAARLRTREQQHDRADGGEEEHARAAPPPARPRARGRRRAPASPPASAGGRGRSADPRQVLAAQVGGHELQEHVLQRRVPARPARAPRPACPGPRCGRGR